MGLFMNTLPSRVKPVTLLQVTGPFMGPLPSRAEAVTLQVTSERQFPPQELRIARHRYLHHNLGNVKQALL